MKNIIEWWNMELKAILDREKIESEKLKLED